MSIFKAMFVHWDGEIIEAVVKPTVFHYLSYIGVPWCMCKGEWKRKCVSYIEKMGFGYLPEL